MKRGALVALALLLAALTLAGVLLRRVDPEVVRDAVERRLEAALALPVELGAAELVGYPLPALHIRDVRIGAAPGPRVEAPELRVGLSLLALLRGEPEPRALELTSPQLHWSAAAASPAPPASGATVSASGKLRLRVRDGTLEIGALHLEHVMLDGELGAAPTAVFEFSALSPLLGRIEGGRLELGALTAAPEAWLWSANAPLGDVDLATLGAALELPGLGGHATGKLVAAGRGRATERAALELESDLALKGRQFEVAGRVKLAGDLAGQLALDLGGAQLRIAEHFAKPPGVALRLSGVLQPPLRALQVGELQIESDLLRARGQLDIRHEQLELSSGSADLAHFAGWTVPDWVPRSGRAQLEHVRLAAGEWPQAAGQVAEVVVPLGEGVSARLTGKLSNEESRARADELRIEVAGENVWLGGFFDWHARWLEAQISARGMRIAPIADALWGRKNVSGRLYGNLELIGPPARAELAGFGDFDVRDGELPGLSLLRVSGIDALDEEPEGLDRFERISGSFELADQKLEIDEATLLQEFTTAVVSGQFYLQDMTADLTGAVRFDHPTLSDPVVRPILRMAGPLDGLQTHISEADSDEVRKMETRMIEVIRKVEAERRGGPAPESPEAPREAKRSEG